jgi:hypothetical protein
MPPPERAPHPRAVPSTVRSAARAILVFLGLYQGAVPLVVKLAFGRGQRFAPALWLAPPWWWIACIAVAAAAFALAATVDGGGPSRTRDPDPEARRSRGRRRQHRHLADTEPVDIGVGSDAAMLRGVVERAQAGLTDRESLVEVLVLAAVAGEHVLVVGPPGTAKSEAVRRVALELGGSYFEYLLGRFTEPNEVFGPVDLKRLREGWWRSKRPAWCPKPRSRSSTRCSSGQPRS